MESFVNEIIREWHTKLKELEEVKKIIKAEGLLLKDLRIKFMFIKKYFENKERIVISKKQKNFLNLKSSSLTALNLMKEREIKKIKKAYEEIIELEKEEVDDPFKPKQEIKREKVVKKPDVGIEEKLRVIKKPKEKKVVSEEKVSEEMKENKVNVLKVNEDKLVKEKVKENIVKEVKDKAVKDKVVKDDKVEDEVVRKKIVNDKVSEEKDHEDKIVKEQVSEEDKDVKEVKSIENIKPTNENELSKKPIEKHKEPIENPAKLNKIDVKNKMKSLLNAFQSKSQKNGDQNKENIPDRSILVEDGEVKLFIVNKKKRVKDFLKETKRKKNKVENEKEEIVKGKEKAKGKENVKEGEKVKEDSLPKEGNLVEELNLLKEAKPPIETHPLKEINMPTKINPPSKPNPPNETNPPINPIPPKEANLPKEMPLPKDIPSTKEIKPLKEINLSNQLKPKELPTNISNNQPKVNNPTNVFDRTSDLIKKRILKNKTPEKVYDVGTNRFISESNLKNFNLKNLCRSPLKDGLYKNIIDKERKSKSRIGMNKFIPKTPVPEINSDEEESYSGLITEKEISEKLKNQNHEEIEKYFNSEMSVDIEFLFPNIKEISNDSPNKWG